ncbi:PSP1 C-terminal conserved region-domain-containing protein [Mycena haematopus]|nr:PSP1 C-terminal conserved region-domain-containing protein [Mycena haematopus]
MVGGMGGMSLQGQGGNDGGGYGGFTRRREDSLSGSGYGDDLRGGGGGRYDEPSYPRERERGGERQPGQGPGHGQGHPASLPIHAPAPLGRGPSLGLGMGIGVDTRGVDTYFSPVRERGLSVNTDVGGGEYPQYEGGGAGGARRGGGPMSPYAQTGAGGGQGQYAHQQQPPYSPHGHHSQYPSYASQTSAHPSSAHPQNQGQGQGQGFPEVLRRDSHVQGPPHQSHAQGHAQGQAQGQGHSQGQGQGVGQGHGGGGGQVPGQVELGKGLPLHAVPPEWPLYIVEFKAGRTDLFYRAADRMASQGRNGNGKGYAADDDPIRVGDLVIVEADRGKDLGKVVNDTITLGEVEAFWAGQQRFGSGQSPPTSPGGADGGTGAKKEIAPKMIYGKAGAGDAQLLVAKMQDELKALALCQTKVRAKKLPMEVVDAEYQWDRRKLTFYFVAEKRIDFRELVRELFRCVVCHMCVCPWMELIYYIFSPFLRSSSRLGRFAVTHPSLHRRSQAV